MPVVAVTQMLQLAAAYLARQYPRQTSSNVKWALAGRSEDKLEQLCKRLADTNIDTIVCDVNDAEAVESVVKSTKVVANFAGTPFADKAALVVESCARNGCHYVDITGEICLHKASFDTCHDTCKKTGRYPHFASVASCNARGFRSMTLCATQHHPSWMWV